MPILETSELLGDLGVANPTQRDTSLMANAQRDAIGAIETYLGYPVERRTVTEYYPVARQQAPRDEFVEVRGQRAQYRNTGDSTLALEGRPVLSDSRLLVHEQSGAMSGQADGAFPSDSLLARGADYFLDVTAVPPARTVTNKALTSNVATLTTSVAHGLVAGDEVVVSGVDATFNGTQIITAVASTTTFSYAKTATNVASAASSGSVQPAGYSMSGLLYRRSGTWLREIGGIRVQYRTGFSQAELAGTGPIDASQIKAAIYEETVRLWRQRRVNQVTLVAGVVAGQITSESIGGYSYGTGGNVAEVANVLDLSHSAKMRLQRWRKVGGRLI